MTSEGFTYAKLPISTASKEIRLLRLSDRSTPGPPSCEIFNASLGEVHSSSDGVYDGYEALSYTWGNSKSRDVILLGGSRTSVTANLARALEDVRLDHGSRVLWVDALCIDQNNVSERNHQVKQMGAIYRNAKRVLAWLGRPVSGAKPFLDSPEQLSELQLHGSLFPVLEVQLKDAAFDEYYRRWVELLAACELPYWRRLWIVQEIGLAADIHVYHGHSFQDWRLFSKIRQDLALWINASLFPESFQVIAKSIMESVPGKLDQQRDVRLPLWFREIESGLQRLISQASAMSTAINVLWEASLHFGKFFHGGRRISSAPNSDSTPWTPSCTDMTGFLGKLAQFLDEDLDLPSEEVLQYIAKCSPDVNDVGPHPTPLCLNFGELTQTLPKYLEFFIKRMEPTLI